MHLPIFAALFVSVFMLIISAGFSIHRHYQRRMSASVTHFEHEWKKLEKRYDKVF